MPHNPNAFPAAFRENDGMTLRDYFAAAVMQGLTGDIALTSFQDGSKLMDLKPFDMAARMAYDVADAMLKAREAGQ